MILQVSAYLCKFLQVSASLSKVLRVSISLCKFAQVSASMCRFLKFIQVYGSLRKLLQLCMNLPKSLHVCANFWKFVQFERSHTWHLPFLFFIGKIANCANFDKFFQISAIFCEYLCRWWKSFISKKKPDTLIFPWIIIGFYLYLAPLATLPGELAYRRAPLLCFESLHGLSSQQALLPVKYVVKKELWNFIYWW